MDRSAKHGDIPRFVKSAKIRDGNRADLLTNPPFVSDALPWWAFPPRAAEYHLFAGALSPRDRREEGDR
jgi:hypothetical protein